MKAMLGILGILGALLLLPGLARAADTAPTPLFAADDMIRLTIAGPVAAVARTRGAPSEPRPATLALTGSRPERHAILLSPRGITRRKSEVCDFSPLRVEFAQKPAGQSLFRGQKRLKLVTHCRSSAGHQQYLLLEYAAYRLLNRLTPLSFRVRLAAIDYVGDDGKPLTSRLGFFIEDIDDVAARNGMKKAQAGDRIAPNALNPRDAARFAAFEYMIGNLDWSMTGGTPGEGCCHNARLVGPVAGGFVPVPYDFDFAGMVDAPYAVPPNGMNDLANVRERRYRGYCLHNREAATAASELGARRAELQAVLAAIPQLEERPRRKAAAYLDSFFDKLAGDRDYMAKVLKTCRD